eukprot:14162096-Heterocapsa_arctica.AAC.2
MEANLAELAAQGATAGGDQGWHNHRPAMLTPEEYAARDHAARMEDARVRKAYVTQAAAELEQGLAPKMEGGKQTEEEAAAEGEHHGDDPAIPSPRE